MQVVNAYAPNAVRASRLRCNATLRIGHWDPGPHAPQ